MTAQPDYKIKTVEILEALTEARFNISEAARVLTLRRGESVTRAYVAKACSERPPLLEAVEDFREAMVDRSETNVFDAVMGGDVRISMNVLQTIGKNRGWVQKQEVEVNDPTQTLAKLQEGRARAKAARKEEDPSTKTIAEHPLGEAPVDAEKQGGEAETAIVDRG